MHPTIELDELKGYIRKKLKHLNADKKAINDMKKRVGTGSVFKDAQISEKARAKGNNHYTSDRFDSMDRSYQLYQTLHIYNESIAYAPIGSQELALAYHTRSAVLFRLRRYKQCITEVDKALDIIESPQIKVKLLCRKRECLDALGLRDDGNCLKEAKSLHNSMQDSGRIKKVLSNLINKAENGNDDTGSDDEYLRDVPKDGRRSLESLEAVTEAEKKDVTNAIKVKFSRKMGRHLVAARDFEPGEIIMVESPYHSQIHYSIGCQYCYHCMEYLWTVVPCDHCTWRLFCSEECKVDSWNEYHDLECSVISHLRVVFELEKNPFIPLLMSIFSKMLKEAGSIDELQADLESLDCGCKISPLDVPVMSYKSILASPIRDLEEDELTDIIHNSVFSLIGLAKYSSLFVRSYDFRELGKLMRDKTAIFVGAFFLKISWMIASKVTTFRLYDPGEDVITFMQRDEFLRGEAAWVRRTNASFNATSMLTLVGCIPNFGTSRTYKGKVVLWAIQPIKAGDQLVAYLPPTVYDYSSTPVREPTSLRYFNRPCTCKACNEDWSEIILQPTKIKGELWIEMCNIVSEWERKSGEPDYPNIDLVSRIRKLAAKSWIEYPMPSAMYVYVMRIMYKVFQVFFTSSEIVAYHTDLHDLKI